MAYNREEKVTEIWQLYQAGLNYNNNLYPPYYATNDKNERFLNGDQWYKVQNNGLPTPQLNIFKRVFSFIKAYLKSSRTAVLYSAVGVSTMDDSEDNLLIKDTVNTVNDKIKMHWEDSDIDGLISEVLEDAVVTGDMCAYVYWDEFIENGKLKGDFVTERFAPQNVMFGNPNCKKVNHRGRPKQPYILLIGRDTVKRLKEEAKQYGATKEVIDKICSDKEYTYEAGDRGKIEIEHNGDLTNKATYIIKLEYNSKTKTIHMSKSVKEADIIPSKDTKLKLYPVAWENWDSRTNSYHGQAPMTGYIPNQIFINKALSIQMVSMMNTASPKVIYDKSRIPNWSNSPSAAIGVDGEITNTVQTLQVGQMNNGVNDMIAMVIKMTIEAMGGNEAVLGNVNPENKSAIVQVTKQASIPYSNQRENLNRFIEQLAYIWLDFLKNYYGEVPVTVSIPSKDGRTATKTLNMGYLIGTVIKPKIDVGESAYYSEPASQAILDAAVDRGMISNIQYFKRLPEGSVKDQDQLVEELTREAEQMLQQEQGMAQQEQMAQQQQAQTLQQQMVAFVQTLPPEEQQKIASMGEDAEAYVVQLMNNPETVRSIRRELENKQREQQVGKKIRGV